MTQITKTWQVIDVIRHGKANSPLGGESEYISVRFKPVTEGKKVTGEVPMTKTFFKNQHPDMFDNIAEGYDFQNGKVTDREKLKEVTTDGYQATLKVDPFFVMDNQGNYVKYPQGDPDQGKPRIRDKRTVLVLVPGDTEDELRDMINSLNARNGSKMVVEENTEKLNEYHNSTAKDILAEYNQGDAASDGEELGG